MPKYIVKEGPNAIWHIAVQYFFFYVGNSLNAIGMDDEIYSVRWIIPSHQFPEFQNFLVKSLSLARTVSKITPRKPLNFQMRDCEYDVRR